MSTKISKIQQRLAARKKAVEVCNSRGDFQVYDKLIEHRKALVHVMRNSSKTSAQERMRVRQMLTIIDGRISDIGKVPDFALTNFDITADLSPAQFQEFMKYSGDGFGDKENNMWQELHQVVDELAGATRASLAESAITVKQAVDNKVLKETDAADVQMLIQAASREGGAFLKELDTLAETCKEKGPHVTAEQIAEFLTIADRMHTLPSELEAAMMPISRALLRRCRPEAMQKLEEAFQENSQQIAQAQASAMAAVGENVQKSLEQISEGLDASFDHPQAQESIDRLQATTDASPTE